MIDIRGNFFYTRTVPCQLWFFDRAKERDSERAGRVLMLDARNIHRKVSRAVYLNLKGLNEEAEKLAARIARNFEELGV